MLRHCSTIAVDKAIIRFTEAGSEQSVVIGEATFHRISSPNSVCLAIADRAKLYCRRRDIDFERKSCLDFVNFPDILRNVDDSKRDIDKMAAMKMNFR